MLAQVAFDTLAYANRLKAAGEDPKMAEVYAEANAEMITTVLEKSMATKQDLGQVEYALKQDLVGSASKLQSQIFETKTELNQEIHGIKIELNQKIHDIKIELNQKIFDTEMRLNNKITEVQNDMKEMETRLTLRLGGIVIGGMTLLTAIFSFLHIH